MYLVIQHEPFWSSNCELELALFQVVVPHDW